MNSRERVLKALNHQEPDQIPFDLSGSIATGITCGAYRKLQDRSFKLVDFQILFQFFQFSIY